MTDREPQGLGEVVLVGAGPGDPGLLTRAGANWLARADVVVFDQLSDPRLLGLAPASAERIAAGKSKGKCLLSQDEINQLLVEKSREGKRVVRLKGGDPYVFGRGAEEAEFLRSQGVPFRVIPGVTAGVGVTSYAGIPVTHRGTASAVAFVTGHHDPKAPPLENGRPRVDWSAIARFPGTVVVYMGISRLPAITEVLIQEGLPADTPAAVVASGTLPSQRTFVGALAELPEIVQEAGVGSPALLVIGEVVRHRSDLSWFEQGPLFGQRIIVTRPAEEGLRVCSSLEDLGAEVILAPTVQILPLDDHGPLDSAIGRLAEFDWIVFTSPNGVKRLIARILELGKDLRVFGRLSIAAIGPATADAIASFHLQADLVPRSYRSEGLAEELLPRVIGKRVLLARADRGRTLLRDELSAVAEVEQVAVYRNVDAPELPESVLERIEAGSVDWITLTSSAITERLHALLSPAARGRVGTSIQLASISPVTTAAAERLGWQVAVEATQHDWPGLVEALLAHLRRAHEKSPDALRG